MRGVRPDLPEWVDALDQVHKLALINAVDQLEAGIKQFGVKNHGSITLPTAFSPDYSSVSFHRVEVSVSSW
jgi:hypothetical protein